jgi:hypothetical protein
MSPPIGPRDLADALLFVGWLSVLWLLHLVDLALHAECRDVACRRCWRVTR